jgi:hypothetical protein
MNKEELIKLKKLNEKRYSVQPHWPKTYKGYKVEYLMQILKEINFPGGTKANEEEIRVMNEFLRLIKFGVHGLKPLKGQIVI